MDEKKYSQLYQALLQEVLQFHNGNQRRIRKGMLSLLLVPLAFLVLLFLSEGSRVIFLLLWIVSMFGIAAYLIAVEYIDYEMQNKVKQITKKEVELDQLTALPAGMPQLLPRLRGRGQESEAAPAEERPARSGEPEKKEVPVPDPEAAQPQDGGAFARLFDDQAWDRYYGSPEAETPAAEPESVTESAAEPAPVPEPVFVPENPAPVPPVSASDPGQNPPLSQTLDAIRADAQQLAQGLDQLSRELGRISRYMEDQKNRTKEARK